MVYLNNVEFRKSNHQAWPTPNRELKEKLFKG